MYSRSGGRLTHAHGILKRIKSMQEAPLSLYKAVRFLGELGLVDSSIFCLVLLAGHMGKMVGHHR